MLAKLLCSPFCRTVSAAQSGLYMQEVDRLPRIMKELLQKLHRATRYELQNQLLTACVLLMENSRIQERAPHAVLDKPVEVCFTISSPAWHEQQFSLNNWLLKPFQCNAGLCSNPDSLPAGALPVCCIYHPCIMFEKHAIPISAMTLS